ncbi:MAG: sigma-70 family RNA polymerase sigma factor [Planctomycetes bacterium]|nr:sigma-70 family RNA polymerase sigma factor [Planctomycetota bacterium]
MLHRERLKRVVRLRLDKRLQSRLDPSDVVQDAFIEASRRLENYLESSRVPLFIWLRFLTGQRLQDLHRRHLGAQARDARREISLYQDAMPEASSAAIAMQIAAAGPSPSKAAALEEKILRLEQALNRMDAVDREVLALRHFERLTSAETGQLLGMKPSSVRSRYLRALKRLKEIMAGMKGEVGEGF